MNTRDFLLGMELGAWRSFENMAVFPLRLPGNGGPEYITLGEALERGALAVTEVSAGGSVPELMVENKGEVAVLILDGEELAGAKQNRVLNTTILVGPKSAIKIPVSCTEHGRWNYISREFAASGNVMAPGLRQVNMQRVHSSLRSGGRFEGDQFAVWDGIARMHAEARVESMTGAMRDVYEAKRTALEDYLKSFPMEAGQRGALILIWGEVAGLDFVSREAAYARLHAKLLKSYAMEAMLQAERTNAGRGVAGLEGPEGPDRHLDSDENPGGEEQARGRARGFLNSAAESRESRYQSVGLGDSLRYEGRDVIGSALALDGGIIHLAFFKASGSDLERIDEMAALSSRRRFRV